MLAIRPHPLNTVDFRGPPLLLGSAYRPRRLQGRPEAGLEDYRRVGQDQPEARDRSRGGSQCALAMLTRHERLHSPASNDLCRDKPSLPRSVPSITWNAPVERVRVSRRSSRSRLGRPCWSDTRSRGRAGRRSASSSRERGGGAGCRSAWWGGLVGGSLSLFFPFYSLHRV
jgi:hypothetical protein